MEYKEEDFLQLSGLQHFAFCRRQWALIHMEQQWAENYHTADGRIMHKNVHDGDFKETRRDCIITRAMRIHSAALGVSGECDVLEFHLGNNGIELPNRAGLWQPFPVEYKRGAPKSDNWDMLQLCGQAMCLEEMLCCDIPNGALYYGETHRRQDVYFEDALRKQVRTLFQEMHGLYSRGITPKVKPTKACNACSLKELCLPKLMRKKSASGYIKEHMEEADETFA
ncbi:MAG: CRISPR-associated protein Cas4 [Roseburia sp.]|nr:CRISPR-associated protein Cas4 [Roseburia sp.]